MFDRPLPDHNRFPLDTLTHILSPDALRVARRRVCRQLFEALVFEAITPAEVAVEGFHLRVTVHGTNAEGCPVQYTAKGERQAFGRLKLDATPVQRTVGGETTEVDCLARLLAETRSVHGAESGKLAQFARELEQTIAKDAQWLSRATPGAHREAPYDDIESAVGNGHPYHPCYKSRIGFDLQDNATYGPEFSPNLHPIWLGARAVHTRGGSLPQTQRTDLLRRDVGERTWSQWSRQLQAAGADFDTHFPIAVHPWQWRHRIQPLMYEDLCRGDLIPLDSGPTQYRPQQSIRTWANQSQLDRLSLKLSLSIVNTSTERILAPHTVANAPLVSHWLHSIVDGDPLLRTGARPVLLREVMGAAYDRPPAELLQAPRYGSLSCIWRESIHPHLGPEERVIPWTALTALAADGRPFVQPWIAEWKGAWLPRLIDTALVPLLHLLAAHGVGLESHAQNLLLIHRGGLPVRAVFKDFHDGVRFSPQHLADSARAPQLESTPEHHVRINRNSFLTADTPEAVRDFAFDAFFFVNLGEMAAFFAEHLDIPFSSFWGCVERSITEYVKSVPWLKHRCELFDVLPESIEVERLTNRRLFPETDAQVHRVPCPWAPPNDFSQQQY